MRNDNLRDGRVRNWFYLENDLLDRGDLTIYEKTVYIVIARYVNGENKAFPSYETIAKKGSMAKVQAMRIVKSLIKKGLLKKEVRKDKDNKSYTSNLYTLLSPKSKDKSNIDKKGVVSDRYQGGVPHIPGVVSHRYPNNTNIKNTNLNNVNSAGSKEVVENSGEEINEKTVENEEDINDIRRKIKESLEENRECNFTKPKDSENDKNTGPKGKYSNSIVVEGYHGPNRYRSRKKELLASSMGIFSSVIEPPIGSPAIFNWVGIEDRLDGNEKDTGSDFYSYPHEISCGNRIKSKAEYVFDGISWIVSDDRKEKIKEWNYNKMLKLVYASGTTPVTLIDIGVNVFHESVKPLLSVVDIVLVLIDPFPTSCKIGGGKLSELLKLKGEGYPVNFIINKWNDGINKKEFLDFLGVKPLTFIPAIDLAVLYKANCKYEMPLSYREVSEVMESPLKKISSLFLPEEFSSNLSKNKKCKKGFLGIIKKFAGV